MADDSKGENRKLFIAVDMFFLIFLPYDIMNTPLFEVFMKARCVLTSCGVFSDLTFIIQKKEGEVARRENITTVFRGNHASWHNGSSL